MNYITFDIETYNPVDDAKGNFHSKIDPKQLKTSVVGAYISWLDKYLVFWEKDIEYFLGYLKKADLVIGFNHLWFDLPVLQKYSKFNLLSLHSYDIMLEFEKKVGYKIKLDNLAKSNLNISKTDSYATFRSYHLQNKWFELADYCMHDVLITEKLFRMVLEQKPIKYSDMLTTREILLDLPIQKKQVTLAEEEELF